MKGEVREDREEIWRKMSNVFLPAHSTPQQNKLGDCYALGTAGAAKAQVQVAGAGRKKTKDGTRTLEEGEVTLNLCLH
jgi:hypothetical protein